MDRGFRQVDVFGADTCMGNPVAVVLDETGLDDETLRRFSVWSNLSECTFVLPPTTPAADYRVRIFSLNTELPFAGHPTLGTARAWLGWRDGLSRSDSRVVSGKVRRTVPMIRKTPRISGMTVDGTAVRLARPGHGSRSQCDDEAVGRCRLVDLLATASRETNTKPRTIAANLVITGELTT